MRFDDAIAYALELGPLCQNDVSIPNELDEWIQRITPKEIPPEDSD